MRLRGRASVRPSGPLFATFAGIAEHRALLYARYASLIALSLALMREQALCTD